MQLRFSNVHKDYAQAVNVKRTGVGAFVGLGVGAFVGLGVGTFINIANVSTSCLSRKPCKQCVCRKRMALLLEWARLLGLEWVRLLGLVWGPAI